MPKVFLCRFPPDEPSVPEGLLSAYRKEKLASQTNARVRRQSLYAELLLRHALRACGISVEGPLAIAAGEHGKPFLKDGGLFFSLSHSAEAVLCALGESELGADIQIRTEAKPDLIKRFFAPDEQEYVFAAANADEAFTEIWTKKESLCKRGGQGLTLSLPSFSVLEKGLAPRLWHTTAGDYHIAVCCESPPDRIELIETDAGSLLP